MKPFLLLSIAVLLQCYDCKSQVIKALYDDATSRFTVSQLHEDFETFKVGLKNTHPSLYWYRSWEEMNEYFDIAKNAITQPMTERELLRLLSSVISKIGCGHTHLRLSEETLESLRKSGSYFPIKLKFIGGRAYCLQNNSNDPGSIQPGNEVMKINEFNIDSLLQLSLNTLWGDGYIETGKIWILNNFFKEFYAEAIGVPDTFSVTYIDSFGEQKTLKVKPHSYNEIELNQATHANNPEEDNANISLSYVDKTAILKITAFFGWEENGKMVDFDKELRSAFEKIDSATVKFLIIDVRENQGGRAPISLFSYLYVDKFKFFKQMDFKVSEADIIGGWESNKFLVWLNSTFFYRTKKINDSTSVILSENYLLKTHKPSHPQFDGRVLVLMNGGTYSAASDFTAMVKSHQLSTFIGEETGGGYYGNTSFVKKTITLPNTQIRLDIPMARHTLCVSDVEELGRGTLPDHTVIPTIEDIVNNVDTELNYALELIRTEQSGN